MFIYISIHPLPPPKRDKGGGIILTVATLYILEKAKISKY
jgi:hypothetical protein